MSREGEREEGGDKGERTVEGGEGWKKRRGKEEGRKGERKIVVRN